MFLFACLLQAQTPVGKWISNLKYFDQTNYDRMELELNGDKRQSTFRNGKIEANVKAGFQAID